MFKIQGRLKRCRVGANGSTFNAWNVNSAGNINNNNVTNTNGASPVLYLESDVVGSGEGTLSDPYILSNQRQVKNHQLAKKYLNTWKFWGKIKIQFF